MIGSDQWVSPPDNPTTRKEKERESGHEVEPDFLLFFLVGDKLNLACSFCCLDYECVSEYVEHVLTGKQNRPKQSLKITEGF